MYELPVEQQNELFITIGTGDFLKLHELLTQIKISLNIVVLFGQSLVEKSLALRQIGITRILIKVYSLKINKSGIFEFLGSGAPESEVIDLITEFNVDINCPNLVLFALHSRCFEIIKYAIEECSFNINHVRI